MHTAYEFNMTKALDETTGIDDEDLRLAEAVRGKRVIALLNKTDLTKDGGPEGRSGAGEVHASPAETAWAAAAGAAGAGTEPIRFSAVDGTGLAELKARIEELFFAGKLEPAEDVWLANTRQRQALAAAKDSLGLVRGSIEAGMPEDMFTIDLADAYRELGLILGEEVEDELIDKIFAEFCMGK